LVSRARETNNSRSRDHSTVIDSPVTLPGTDGRFDSQGRRLAARLGTIGRPMSDRDPAHSADLDAIPRDAIPRDEAAAVLGGPAIAAERLGHSRLGPTRGVWRVDGAGGATAILKVVGPRDDEGAEASRRPASYQFWAREEAVLDHGLPPPYPDSGVRGPRLLGRFERGDGAIALWLEDVDGRSGADLSLDDFAGFARRLGEAQGRIAAAAAIEAPWASRGFLGEYLEARPVAPGSTWRLEADDPRWDLPAMAAVDRPLRAELIRLQREREWFLDRVEGAPRTLAHLDVWPSNVFVRPTGEVVLIDWAFAGEGALGEDIGNLVPDAVFDLLHPPTILDDLDRTVFAGYVDGLRRGGWDGDERVVRLAMCASAVKYDWIAAGMLMRTAFPEQRIYGLGPPVSTERFFGVRASVMRFLAGWAAEARQLAADLGHV
jgi:hypothetical protein